MDRPSSCDPEVRIALAEMQKEGEWRYRFVVGSLEEIRSDMQDMELRLLSAVAMSARAPRPSPIPWDAISKAAPYLVGPAILLLVYIFTGVLNQAMQASAIPGR